MSTNTNPNGNKLYAMGITMVATLGGLLFGYDTAVISGAIGYLNEYFQLDAAGEGFAAASILLGCVAGAIVAGSMSSSLGRKRSLIVAALLFIVASVGTALPTQYWQLILARFVGGIGVGIASMISPMYIAEISPANIRGRLVSFNQFAIVFGILLSFFINYLINDPEDIQWCVERGWRIMFLAMAVPSTLFFLLLFLVPESPRWLVMRNRADEAKKVLFKVNGENIGQKIFNDIKTSLENEKRELHGSIFVKGIFGAVVIGCLLSIFQQITGINTILYYAPEIFKNMGSSSDSAFLQTVLVGVVNVLFTIIAILSVDKFGRKPLLLLGSLGMGIGMLGLGTFAFNGNLGLGALVFIMVYIAAFAMSWGPVTWVMVSEIFPNSVRSLAMSIAVAAQWVFNFVVSQTFPMMLRNDTLIEKFNGGFPFFIYGGFAIIAIFFVWLKVPETKGKSLEEMERVWVH